MGRKSKKQNTEIKEAEANPEKVEHEIITETTETQEVETKTEFELQMEELLKEYPHTERWISIILKLHKEDNICGAYYRAVSKLIKCRVSRAKLAEIFPQKVLLSAKDRL